MACFHPYADAMTEAVERRIADSGRAVIIDVHSYPTVPLPYELHGAGPRPPVCPGTGPVPYSAELRATAEAAFGGRGGHGGIGATLRSRIRTPLAAITERTAGSPR